MSKKQKGKDKIQKAWSKFTAKLGNGKHVKGFPKSLKGLK